MYISVQNKFISVNQHNLSCSILFIGLSQNFDILCRKVMQAGYIKLSRLVQMIEEDHILQ